MAALTTACLHEGLQLGAVLCCASCFLLVCWHGIKSWVLTPALHCRVVAEALTGVLQSFRPDLGTT